MGEVTLTVDLGERSYPIWIGPSLLAELATSLAKLGLDERRKVLVVTDDHVAPLYLKQVLKSLKNGGYHACSYTVPAGEKAKSLSYYEAVISYALQQRLDR